MDLLSDGRLLLRALEPEDLDFLYACENNTQIWQVSHTLVPYSRYVLKQYLANAHLDIYTAKQLRLLMVPVNNPKNPIGALDLFDFDPYHSRAGLGILIHRDQDRQQGYATSALQLITSYSFSHLHLHQLYANIGASNIQSIRLFEKNGFTLTGTKKDWLKRETGWEDELMYQLIH
ncbi:MAG TPA: GNAT family N-acetyltransferase [Marinilabiliales bacterium]|jgi:diamine N-acetyltransferase|nr:MAG: GNAT family N-acetyltransferase [Bacteroidetes bacterium GWD2_40_43]OFX88431.1 MAG: GNAT family N-acetyltransferase [Bacteroidetes bacterium GWE2_40_63]OFY22589.1 MAG: GNAT family N-acetyltransferase [Bacteroidetes bacterium GWF2_40_13]OFZ29596.1 MAG: GNAT family N-acetyltransferase [Bacteroidetes bacterium RIFOXYC2_FULL_40_12]HAN00261.1 GNAT family N-acetyltransferase [Marinilabiliales bacterium]